MAAVHITPSDAGKAIMIAIAVFGIVIFIDALMFAFGDGKGLLAHMNIAVHLNPKSRALVEGIVGLALAMFGFGYWLPQVGGIAIVILFMTIMGTYWSYDDGIRGGPTRQDVAISTDTSDQCPLTQTMKNWCAEDHDSDGISNRYDEDFNNGIKSGKANCERGWYFPKAGEACKS
jgi:hypothetical protein